MGCSSSKEEEQLEDDIWGNSSISENRREAIAPGQDKSMRRQYGSTDNYTPPGDGKHWFSDNQQYLEADPHIDLIAVVPGVNFQKNPKKGSCTKEYNVKVANATGRGPPILAMLGKDCVCGDTFFRIQHGKWDGLEVAFDAKGDFDIFYEEIDIGRGGFTAGTLQVEDHNGDPIFSIPNGGSQCCACGHGSEKVVYEVFEADRDSGVPVANITVEPQKSRGCGVYPPIVQANFENNKYINQKLILMAMAMVIVRDEGTHVGNLDDHERGSGIRSSNRSRVASGRGGSSTTSRGGGHSSNNRGGSHSGNNRGGGHSGRGNTGNSNGTGQKLINQGRQISGHFSGNRKLNTSNRTL